MRPIGITWVGFVYVFSLGLFLADAVILSPVGMTIAPLAGDATGAELISFIQDNSDEIANVGNSTLNPQQGDSVIDRVTQFIEGGQAAMWTLLSLLTGSYMFGFLGLIGIHSTFIIVLQLIFGVIVASTIVYYIMGRGA